MTMAEKQTWAKAPLVSWEKLGKDNNHHLNGSGMGTADLPPGAALLLWHQGCL